MRWEARYGHCGREVTDVIIRSESCASLLSSCFLMTCFPLRFFLLFIRKPSVEWNAKSRVWFEGRLYDKRSLSLLKWKFLHILPSVINDLYLLVEGHFSVITFPASLENSRIMSFDHRGAVVSHVKDACLLFWADGTFVRLHWMYFFLHWSTGEFHICR